MILMLSQDWKPLIKPHRRQGFPAKKRQIGREKYSILVGVLGKLGKKRQKQTEKWKRVRKDKEGERYEFMFLFLKQWQDCFWSSSLFVDSFYQADSCIGLNLNLSLRMGICSWFVFVFFPVSHSPFIWTLLENNIAIGKHISSFLKCWLVTCPHTHTYTHLSVCLSIYRKRVRKHPPILCYNFTFLGGGCGSIKWRWTLLLLVELCPHKWNMLKS